MKVNLSVVFVKIGNANSLMACHIFWGGSETASMAGNSTVCILSLYKFKPFIKHFCKMSQNVLLRSDSFYKISMQSPQNPNLLNETKKKSSLIHT